MGTLVSFRNGQYAFAALLVSRRRKERGVAYMFAGVTKQKESASRHTITRHISLKLSPAVSGVSLTLSDLNKSLAWIAHMYSPTCHCWHHYSCPRPHPARIDMRSIHRYRQRIETCLEIRPFQPIASRQPGG